MQQIDRETGNTVRQILSATTGGKSVAMRSAERLSQGGSILGAPRGR
jgi:hypothetical protein